ncbi:tetratricopeptide repeat protein [Vogesella facilis]|uniref:Tetratricopeptide repeat protein n=1 Tax=Vogesella facilis TaxID=1655232 RepID=A0ABV7RBH2_9NEIS
MKKALFGLLLYLPLALPALATETKQLLQDGYYLQAMQQARQALQQLPADDSAGRLRAQIDLANAMMERHQADQAELIFKALLQDSRQVPPSSLIEAEVQEGLAGVYLDRQQSKAAAKLYRRILSIRQQHLGAQHLEVAQTLNDLGVALGMQDQMSESEKLLKQALEIREQLAGHDSFPVAESLYNLSFNHMAPGQYQQAEPMMIEAIRIKQHVLRPDHPSMTRSMRMLGWLYRKQKRFDEAMAQLQATLAMTQRNGEDSLDQTGRTLRAIADCLQDQGKAMEAEQYYRQALVVLPQALGAKHYAVGQTMNNLGWLLKTNLHSSEGQQLITEGQRIMDAAENQN